MKMTRERKVYFAVFALAVGALACDRLLIGRAAGDGAGEDALVANFGGGADALLVPSQQPPASAAGPDRPIAANPAIAITDLLESIRSSQDLELARTPNVFVRDEPDILPLTTEQEIRARALIEQFSTHRLTSVVAGGRWGGGAMVDGQLVRIGQQFDRFRLVSVDAQSALFESTEGVRVRLSLGGESRAAMPTSASASAAR